MRNGRSSYFDRSFFFDLAGILRGRCRLAAAFNNKSILKFNTICIYESGLIVRVEEVLFPELHDLLVEPVKERFIALSHRRRDGVRAAQ